MTARLWAWLAAGAALLGAVSLGLLRAVMRRPTPLPEPPRTVREVERQEAERARRIEERDQAAAAELRSIADLETDDGVRALGGP